MNKNLVLGLAAIGLVGAGIGAGFWLGGHRVPMAPSMAAAAADATEKKPLYYYDPMYPQQKFDKPGKSPFMDMMLVPVFGDDGSDAGSVKISSRVVQNLGIRTGEVTLGTLDKKVHVVGAVVFDERAVAVVQARVSGFIEKQIGRAHV